MASVWMSAAYSQRVEKSGQIPVDPLRLKARGYFERMSHTPPDLSRRASALLQVASVVTALLLPLLATYGSLPWRALGASSNMALLVRAASLGVGVWVACALLAAGAAVLAPRLRGTAVNLALLALALWASLFLLVPLGLVLAPEAQVTGPAGVVSFLLWAMLMRRGTTPL